MSPGLDGGYACLTLVPIVTVASSISYQDETPGYEMVASYEQPSTRSMISILYNQRPIRRFRMDLSRIDFISGLAAQLKFFFNASIDFLNATHIPPTTVHRLSLTAVLMTAAYGQFCSYLREAGVPDITLSNEIFWRMIPLSSVVCVLCALTRDLDKISTIPRDHLGGARGAVRCGVLISSDCDSLDDSLALQYNFHPGCASAVRGHVCGRLHQLKVHPIGPVPQSRYGLIFKESDGWVDSKLMHA